VAVDAVARARPESAVAFAHAVTEAHYAEGLDPNDPDAYAPLLAAHAPGVALPDIHDPALAERAFAEGRRLGIRAFPTLLLEHPDGTLAPLPMLYDPETLVGEISARLEDGSATGARPAAS
jgi:protein-disulfide isomerase-like protein with CxxC motif